MTSLAYTRTRRSVGEQAVRYGLFAAAAVSIVTTTLIILSLLRETIAFFGDVPLGDFLFGTKWTPLLAGDQQSFGVIPLLTGTLYVARFKGDADEDYIPTKINTGTGVYLTLEMARDRDRGSALVGPIILLRLGTFALASASRSRRRSCRSLHSRPCPRARGRRRSP